MLGRPRIFKGKSLAHPRYTTVLQLRRQVNVDFSDDDDYMAGLLCAAEHTVENYIQRQFTEVETDGAIPPPLVMAILIIAAGLYSNREPVAYAVPQAVPYSVSFLLQPYVKYR